MNSLTGTYSLRSVDSGSRHLRRCCRSPFGEKRPAFFRRVAAEAFFEGEALDIWKGLKQPPRFAELDAQLDAELDELLGAKFMPPAKPRD